MSSTASISYSSGNCGTGDWACSPYDTDCTYEACDGTCVMTMGRGCKIIWYYLGGSCSPFSCYGEEAAALEGN
jgi:hypothetical protein